MNKDLVIRMTGRQHAIVCRHLLPGDGLEAAAILLCGRHDGDRHCLSVMELCLVPYDACVRQENLLRWPTSYLEPLLARAAAERLAILKMHSHPGGFDQFSDTDDESDREFFEATDAWCDDGLPHACAVLLPDGRIFGRTGAPNNGFSPVSMISVAGESIDYFYDEEPEQVPDFADRHAQVLGRGTVASIRQLRCAVIGCSGTGSIVVEQLYRLGVGELVLVDPDSIGVENLNRILNSKQKDASVKRSKVEVMQSAILETELGTTVFPFARDLCDPEVIRMVAGCDMLFGCVDSIVGRHVLNKIAATYCIPYIDVGIGIKADGLGGVSHVTGAVHYLQPDGSSLLSRGVYSLEDLRADALRRNDPTEFHRRLSEGYIRGAAVTSPAVISVNMTFAGLAVTEFLCRLHAIRDEGNQGFASQRFSVNAGFFSCEPDGERCSIISRNLGRGEMTPLLGMPELSDSTAEVMTNAD